MADITTADLISHYDNINDRLKSEPPSDMAMEALTHAVDTLLDRLRDRLVEAEDNIDEIVAARERLAESVPGLVAALRRDREALLQAEGRLAGYANRIEALRDQVGRLTVERDEWEANEQEQHRRAEKAEAARDLLSGSFVEAANAFAGMGLAVMQKIADGGSLADVLDVVGDWMDCRDCVDGESIELFNRAKAAAVSGDEEVDLGESIATAARGALAAGIRPVPMPAWTCPPCRRGDCHGCMDANTGTCACRLVDHAPDPAGDETED